MAETNDHQRADHVVLFPFMAQGHLAPFRCLAADLAMKAGPSIKGVSLSFERVMIPSGNTTSGCLPSAMRFTAHFNDSRSMPSR
jgi:hypothetical protein